MTIDLKIEPITRIEGHLGVFTKVNISSRKVENAYTIGIMFRGYEIILKNRVPDTAIFLTSRSCGVCGGAHASASVLACDMALGVAPTPLAASLRNLAYAMTDYTYDHTVLLNLLEGPDYSEYIVSKLTPSVFNIAESVKCEHYGYHCYETIADMMKGWNPIPSPGKTYMLCVYYQRLAKEAGTLLFGKFAHPATLVPGGIIYPVTELKELFTYYLPRLFVLVLWTKFLLSQWIDMFNFYYNQVEVKEIGETYARCQGLTYEPAIMLSAGLFEDPFSPIFTSESAKMSFSEIYEGFDDAFSRRLFKPGLAIGGNIVYRKFSDMQRNMVELITSAYYEGSPIYMSRFVSEDPEGKPLAGGVQELVPFHEWNKETVPRPGKLPSSIPESWSGSPYSWCTEPRMIINGKLAPFEAGPIAKLWVTSLYNFKISLSDNIMIASTGTGKITIRLPSYGELLKYCQNLVDEAYRVGILPEHVDFRSTIPEELYGLPRSLVPDLYDMPLEAEWWNERSTTLFRLYARAISLVCATLSALWSLSKLIELYKERPPWYNVPGRPWKYPEYPIFALGVGWLEAPRGAVRHWIVVKDGKIANYQYHAPTTGNATPRTDLSKLAKMIGTYVEPISNVRGAVRDGCVIGPYEAASMNTYITEEVPYTEWTGLDVVRAIRSFDPCIGCAVHVQILSRRVERYLSPVYWSI